MQVSRFNQPVAMNNRQQTNKQQVAVRNGYQKVSDQPNFGMAFGPSMERHIAEETKAILKSQDGILDAIKRIASHPLNVKFIDNENAVKIVSSAGDLKAHKIPTGGDIIKEIKDIDEALQTYDKFAVGVSDESGLLPTIDNLETSQFVYNNDLTKKITSGQLTEEEAPVALEKLNQYDNAIKGLKEFWNSNV